MKLRLREEALRPMTFARVEGHQAHCILYNHNFLQTLRLEKLSHDFNGEIGFVDIDDMLMRELSVSRQSTEEQPVFHVLFKQKVLLHRDPARSAGIDFPIAIETPSCDRHCYKPVKSSPVPQSIHAAAHALPCA